MTRMPRRGLIDLHMSLAVTLAILVFISCLFGLGAKVDGLELQREQALASNALRGRMQEVADQATANTDWDDAVDRASNRIDLPWISENIGAYYTQPRRFRFVCLLNGAGRAVFAMERGRPISPERFTGLLGRRPRWSPMSAPGKPVGRHSL